MQREFQQWVLLGTAPASKEVWGVSEINFPCGYMMPPGAFAMHGQPLERPHAGEVWAMGGFALELAEGGKMISIKDAPRHVAGYRPWVCLFHATLLDELKVRGHTIEMWDRGVSIFHGLWNQASQSLGELIPVDGFDDYQNCETALKIGDEVIKGSASKEYVHDAGAIIHFMSQFMTLSEGDQWIQGPLVAARLPADVGSFSLQVGGLQLEAKVD